MPTSNGSPVCLPRNASQPGKLLLGCLRGFGSRGCRSVWRAHQDLGLVVVDSHPPHACNALQVQKGHAQGLLVRGQQHHIVSIQQEEQVQGGVAGGGATREPSMR